MGESYDECTTKGNDGIAWCATEVDASGFYLNDKWGVCAEGCPGMRNHFFLSFKIGSKPFHIKIIIR
jgi:hypothetical protein